MASSNGNEEESKDIAKNLEDVKTVSFQENTGTTAVDVAAATASSGDKPPPIPVKSNAATTSPRTGSEERKGVDSGNRSSVRNSVNGGSAMPTSGNATLQQTAGLMHEEDDEEHYFGTCGGLDNHEDKEDPKRKFALAR